MQFVLKPSLEHMALVKIGVSLWNQNDVSVLILKLSLILKYRYILCPSEWEKIEEKVTEKVPQLSLPQILKEKVFGVIKPIGLQIFDWMQYYRRYDACDLNSDLPVHLPADLCWTPQGTVDRKRTAEVLLRNENLHVFRRYRLACGYFLEDDIIRFWNRLPRDLKDDRGHNLAVINFWSDNMTRVRVGHISFQEAFYSSLRDRNKVAAKYFLQKLNPQEREESLKELAEHIKDADVLLFLLSEMEKEQQMLVFKSDPCRVFWSFLQWPFQSFFLRIANCIWDFLSKDKYDKILRGIIGKVRDGYKDYNYQKLFREFWQKSPRALKDSLIEDIDNSWLVSSLFRIKDKEIIRLIIKDANLEAKEKLIYSDAIKYVCLCSIHDSEYDFLEVFIRECLPSKNEMLKFKVKFEKSMMHSCFKELFATKKQEWDQLFHFSDDSFCKSDKRSVEEGKSDFRVNSNTCLKQGKKLF